MLAVIVCGGAGYCGVLGSASGAEVGERDVRNKHLASCSDWEETFNFGGKICLFFSLVAWKCLTVSRHLTQKEINLGLDSEFDSIHFCVAYVQQMCTIFET